MANQNQLDKFRIKIDEIDNQILGLIADRILVVDDVARVKAKNGLKVNQPARFSELIERLKKKGHDIGVGPELVEAVWGAIHDSSLAQQEKVSNTDIEQQTEMT